MLFRLRPIVVLAGAWGFSWLTAAATCAAPFDPTQVPTTATPKEISLGKKAVAEIASDPKVKFLDLSVPANKALSDKLNAMASVLGKASLRPRIAYDVKIIDNKDVNAFTVPNGHVYVFRGLTELAGSDDELAAVIGHEIGHNAMMHALRGEAKSKPLNWIALAAMAAALTGKAGANVAAIAPYVLTGVMSGYSVDFEKEADKQAIHEMARTAYNPSALVTFMNRLSAEEQLHPKIQLGIFEDHPPSPERAAAALEELHIMHLPYTPNNVVGGPGVAVVTASADSSVVKWDGVPLINIVTAPNAAENAISIAAKVSVRVAALMHSNLHLYELTVSGNDKLASLTARGTEVATASLTMARMENSTPLALVESWKKNFSRVFWTETLKGNT